ncbi:polyprenyl synthetase family protein [Zeaxanthinibacter sp. PT1]|uniref:polyprenyl synthetase family protein n=1 Tax=Zeaxanthinibacter TaxID=561554 RepID=UPI00234AEA17|nr:polyprenyl synthetase family protein [Zeaxanthinibacter sp. PT1]MDC6350384.1 polyprenyl synthetase family protein [Zeaxanthinibacter sp. PT1]
MESLLQYKSSIDDFLQTGIKTGEPDGLYEPMRYILGLGGKRLRPALTLMAAEALGGDVEDSMDAAVALELFHNFSLVHDDIMDNAPVRRGQVTVHEKWDLATGILSGDAMLILSYQLFEKYDAEKFKLLVALFSQTAREVCEGQQYDMEFELQDEVPISLYLTMIANKTAVLVGTAMKMGAILAGASPQVQDACYHYGLNLGIAFQLQDDYLDAFGDPKTFGKQVGGDIIANKKTYLYLKSLELSDQEQRTELQHWFSIKPGKPDPKVRAVKDIYLESGAADNIKKEIKNYTELAFEQLLSSGIKGDSLQSLRAVGEELMFRTV